MSPFSDVYLPLVSYNHEQGVPCIALRFFNVYGPRQVRLPARLPVCLSCCSEGQYRRPGLVCSVPGMCVMQDPSSPYSGVISKFMDMAQATNNHRDRALHNGTCLISGLSTPPHCIGMSEQCGVIS